MFAVEIIKRIIRKEKYNSVTYIKYLKKIGVTIGKNCIIYVPSKTYIDVQNPYMIKIGDNVKISEGCKILTHDFSWCVTCGIDGIITGSVGKVHIGNNVFVGMNSIIMRNVIIEDNVIIGAGSVVTKNCKSGFVYAGVPAKKIMSISEYHEKRKSNQLIEAEECVREYYNKFNKIPDKKILREYIFLYEDRNNLNDDVLNKLLEDSGHFEKTKLAFKNSKPLFNGLDEFLKNCIDDKN